MIATDLDGTLLGKDYQVSRRSARALARAAAEGIQVVLVTGRPARWLTVVYPQLDGPYPAVCANGAVRYDPVSETVSTSQTLTPELLAEVCGKLITSIPGIGFAAEVDGGRRMVHESHYPTLWDDIDPNVRLVTLRELVSVPAVKLLARRMELDPDEFTAMVEVAVGGLVESTHSSHTGLVEMSAYGVTKATGLSELAAEIGIEPSDVIAFGDMPNDVPMLTWAGRGVAMANAHPATKAAAQEVTLSNVDDGVAVYIEKLLQPAL
jgi:Cof subfamily protein (haloacid dehalogenase superfamily)